jgi:hypothetical protein
LNDKLENAGEMWVSKILLFLTHLNLVEFSQILLMFFQILENGTDSHGPIFSIQPSLCNPALGVSFAVGSNVMAFKVCASVQ